MRIRSIQLVVAIAVLGLGALVFFSSGDKGSEASSSGTEVEISQKSTDTTILNNQGGDMEGHTPRGFQGEGTGIFVGDNINRSFPNGDGVQAFLTFDIKTLRNQTISNARLVSHYLHVTGSPFADLGNILVEEVRYSSFSSDIWNIKSSSGKGCVLESVPDEGAVSCDISALLNEAVQKGQDTLQLRLKFETISDSDNTADLASFYKTNSNTNESGIFILEILKSGADITDAFVTVSVVLHLIKESGETSTQRNAENVLALFENTQRIWDQAGVVFEVEVVETTIDSTTQAQVLSGNYDELRKVTVNDGRVHMYYTRSLGTINGIALGSGVGVVSDTTTVNDYRATAHEIGHLFGLSHTGDSRNRLMFRGANGEELSRAEIETVRSNF